MCGGMVVAVDAWGRAPVFVCAMTGYQPCPGLVVAVSAIRDYGYRCFVPEGDRGGASDCSYSGYFPGDSSEKTGAHLSSLPRITRNDRSCGREHSQTHIPCGIFSATGSEPFHIVETLCQKNFGMNVSKPTFVLAFLNRYGSPGVLSGL